MKSHVALLTLAGVLGFAATARADWDWPVLSLEGRPEAPAAGDVFLASAPPVTLDGPEVPDLVADGTGALRDRATGRLLAVTVTGDGSSDPIEALTDEECRGLRGVALQAWTDGIARQVARLDLSRVTLFLDVHAAHLLGRVVPRLPVGVTRLILGGFADFSALLALPSLEFLGLERVKIPPRMLAGLSRLRALRAVGWTDFGDEPLLPLPELRAVFLREAKGLPSIEFLRVSPHLRVLDVSRTGVSDLSPLDGHRELFLLDATGNWVSRLPRGPFPNLREFRAWPISADRERQAWFREENPGCRTAFGATEGLRAAYAGAVEAEFVSLGARGVSYVTRDPLEIEEFLGLIEVDEKKSRKNCAHGCCGDCDVFFRYADEGGDLLNVAHGSMLDTALWNGLLELTPASASAVADFLAARGEWWSRYQLEMLESNEDALLGHSRRLLAADAASIVSSKRGRRCWLKSPQEVDAALPDPVERALAAFRLLGCDESPWGLIYGPVERPLLDDVLPLISREDLGRALARALTDAATTRGAARWTFFGLWRLFPPEALEAALPALAMNGLSSPRAENRRRTIRGLREIGSPAAIDALLAFLHVGFPPRPLPEGEKENAGAWWADLTTDCGRLVPDEAYAALCLARLGAADARPAIEERLGSASGEEARALEEAAALLRLR